MFKRIRFSGLTRVILITMVTGGLIILGLNIRMKYALGKLEQYKHANICQDSPDCRQTKDSVITYSKTVRQSFVIPSRRFSVRYVQKYFYIVRLESENVEFEVEALPLMSTDKTDFDDLKMYVPIPAIFTIGEEQNSAENNFPTGSLVKVEFWKGRPVILFSTLVKYNDCIENQIGAPVITFSGDINDQIPTCSGSWETKFYEKAAIPTIDNPLVYYDSAKQDYEQITIFIGFFVLILLMLKLMSKSKR